MKGNLNVGHVFRRITNPRVASDPYIAVGSMGRDMGNSMYMCKDADLQHRYNSRNHTYIMTIDGSYHT